MHLASGGVRTQLRDARVAAPLLIVAGCAMSASREPQLYGV